MRRPRPKQLQLTTAFEFPEITDSSKPSVTLHKNGRYLLIKANDLRAADVLRELALRMPVQVMREGSFYGAGQVTVTDYHKVELWKHLAGDITKHPYCALLKTYGVEIGTSPSLKNYILKEYPRRVLEATPYPAAEVSNNGVSLFDRASVGTNLLCIKDFKPEGEEKPIFVKGKRYMVVRTGGEGVDKVAICTEEVKDGAIINMVGEGLLFEWSAMDSSMEEYFDDSESIDFGETLDEKYPERILQMERKLDKLSFIRNAVETTGKFPLYEHVRIDALMESLKRGVANCKLMRMGKTSEAITVFELWGTKKVGVVGTKNVRIAWRKEFKRLGMKDYVMVNRLEDLEKPGKYYLMTFEWVKDMWDPTKSERDDYENRLRAPERKVRRKVEYRTKPDDIIVYQYNPCPHCKEPLFRPVLQQDPTGKVVQVIWTSEKGYVCRNKKCVWDTDTRRTSIGEGADWAVKGNRLVHHTGGYVDVDLALHARCSGEQIKGRMCLECHDTDGTWQPPRYRRFKDEFTGVCGDEVHNAKDYNTLNARAMYAFRARRKMVMTGTLLSNSPLDAYWPLHWAIGGPREDFPWHMHDGKKVFESRFCDFVYLEKPTGEIDEETGEEITKTVRKRTPFLINPPDWWKTMQPKIVRRNYDDVLFKKSLLEAGMKQPNVQLYTVPAVMDPKQIALTLDALKDFKKQYEQMVADAEKKKQELNKALVITKMSALRTIATCPERINQRFGRDDIYTGPKGGGKMFHIKALTAKACAAGRKVLILSDFIEMQRNVELELMAYKPLRLVTSWGDDKRDEAVTLFADDPSRQVFIAGTRAVRESIDLSAADVTICCDLLWSPAFQCQAWSRTMAPTPRDRNCEVYLMLSKNSLDEHIYTVFYSKMVGAEQAMDRKVMNRRAMDFDVKFFVERVLEEEEALSLQLRDMGDTGQAYLPKLDVELMEERV